MMIFRSRGHLKYNRLGVTMNEYKRVNWAKVIRSLTKHYSIRQLARMCESDEGHMKDIYGDRLEPYHSVGMKLLDIALDIGGDMEQFRIDDTPVMLDPTICADSILQAMSEADESWPLSEIIRRITQQGYTRNQVINAVKSLSNRDGVRQQKLVKLPSLDGQRVAYRFAESAYIPSLQELRRV